jgi:hypothetical protein
VGAEIASYSHDVLAVVTDQGGDYRLVLVILAIGLLGWLFGISKKRQDKKDGKDGSDSME